MVFLTLYFQLLGMSDFAASLQMALLLGSTALGGLLGGWIGDKAATKYPDHGRILVCQFSVAVGIPFSLTITKVSFFAPGSHDAFLSHHFSCVLGHSQLWRQGISRRWCLGSFEILALLCPNSGFHRKRIRSRSKQQ